MESVGDLVIVDRVPWDWFVSCTTKERSVSDRRLRRYFFALKYQIARRDGVKVDNLWWALRIEEGVNPDHRHFHFLLGGLSHVSTPARMSCIAAWAHLTGTKDPENPRGTCRCRLYNPGRGAAGYLAEVLNASESRGWATGRIELSHSTYRKAWEARRSVNNMPGGMRDQLSTVQGV